MIFELLSQWSQNVHFSLSLSILHVTNTSHIIIDGSTVSRGQHTRGRNVIRTGQKICHGNRIHVMSLALADLGVATSALSAPTFGPKSLCSNTQFSSCPLHMYAKMGTNGSGAPLREILDPPLNLV